MTNDFDQIVENHFKKKRDIFGFESIAGLIEEVLIEVADLLSASVRSTDEVFYFRDGQFFILAPETMQNRVSTLTLRIIESIHQLLVHDSRLSELDVKAGSFSFDGQNADRPQDILKFALSRCSD